MNTEIKTPWYKFYNGVKKHLEYPDTSLYQMIKDSCDKHPKHISYNYFGNKKTYEQFMKQIDQCAKAFKSLGIKYKDKVSICMPNTPEAMISFYALNKVGAIANMIHPLSAENEIKYYLNLVQSEYVICIDLSFNKINHIANQTALKNVL